MRNLTKSPLYTAVALVGLGFVVIFFGWKSIRHHHAIWHGFVLGGSVLHFAAVAFFVM